MQIFLAILADFTYICRGLKEKAMTENQKINLAYGIAVLVLLVFASMGGFIGYFFGYGHGRNATLAEYATDSTETTECALTDYEKLQLAIIFVESEGNPLAIGKNQDLGCMQITPIYVEEVNRILKDTIYHHTDAFCPRKSLEMFSVVQDYHNPNHDIDAAIRLHNRAPWYSQKVLKEIQRINQYEEYRKLVKE